MVSATTVSATVATRRNLPRFDRNAAIQWSVAALTLLLVVVPLLPIFYQAFLDKPLYYPDAAATLETSLTCWANLVSHRHCQHVLLRAGDDGDRSRYRGRVRDPGRADRPPWSTGLRRHPAVAAVYLAPRARRSGLVHHVPAHPATSRLVVQAVLDVEPWNLYSLTGRCGGWAGTGPLAYLYCIASATSVDASLDALRAVLAPERGPCRGVSRCR